MARRLATDAAIVLRNAGYAVQRDPVPKSRKANAPIRYGKQAGYLPGIIPVTGGTVDNAEVERLLQDAKNGGAFIRS